MDEHIELQRQQALNLSIPSGVAVIGCGGVGSWLAYFLALAGVTDLWLFDFDKISESNLNRFPLGPEAVGKSKSVALSDAIKLLRPSCKPVAMGEFSSSIANTIALDAEVDWLAVSTDTWASRVEVHKYAQARGLRYIEASAEGEYGSITGSPADFATPEEDNPGYASVPVWVGPCVAAAMMASAHILHATPASSAVIRLGWDGRTIDYYNSKKSTKPYVKKSA